MQAALALCRHKHRQETPDAEEATAASVQALVPLMLDLLRVCAHYVQQGGRWPRPYFNLSAEKVNARAFGGVGRILASICLLSSVGACCIL